MLFEVHVADQSVDGGMVQVSWCVSREALEALSGHHVRDPYVLIVATPVGAGMSSRSETRKLARLIDGLAYVEFRTHGPHHVHAMVVGWWSGHGAEGLQEYFFGRENGAWETTVLNGAGDGFSTRMAEPYARGNTKCGWGFFRVPEHERTGDDANDVRAIASSVSVNIPDGMFAAPPPEWEAAWVNHWFRHAPVDECDYRRRRLWAYSVQPPMMLAIWMIRLGFTTLALLAGFREVSWAAVRHPLDTSMDALSENFTHGNFFWPESLGKSRVGRAARFALPALTPLSLMALGLLAWVVPGGDVTFFLKSLVAVAAGIPAIATVALLSVGAAGKLAGALVERQQRQRAAPAEYLSDDTVTFLSCDGQPGTTRTLKSVPWRRRSARLIFEATKAQVCRPFAR